MRTSYRRGSLLTSSFGSSLLFAAVACFAVSALLYGIDRALLSVLRAVNAPAAEVSDHVRHSARPPQPVAPAQLVECDVWSEDHMSHGALAPGGIGLRLVLSPAPALPPAPPTEHCHWADRRSIDASIDRRGYEHYGTGAECRAGFCRLRTTAQNFTNHAIKRPCRAPSAQARHHQCALTEALDAYVLPSGDAYVLNGTAPFLLTTGGCQSPGAGPHANAALERRARQAPVAARAVLLAHTNRYLPGDGFFHVFVENIPRLVRCVAWLNSEQGRHVRVHSGYPGDEHIPGYMVRLLELIGLQNARERLVSGELRAERAYLPPKSVCGQAPSTEATRATQSVLRAAVGERASERCRRAVRGAMLGNCSLGTPTSLPPYIVIVDRGRSPRAFDATTRARIDDKLAAGSSHYCVATHRPHDDVDTTGCLYAHALGVIGPHGAGLSNTLFMRSGAFVVEVQPASAPDINLCYHFLGMELGLRYATLTASSGTRDGLLSLDDATAQQLWHAVRSFVAHSGGHGDTCPASSSMQAPA